MGKRRGRGEGAIYQRGDGLWCASISMGYGLDQKRRRKVIYGKSKKDVQAELVKQLAKAAAGGNIDPDRVTVRQFLTAWQEDTLRGTVRASSYIRYARDLGHVTRVLGHLQLAKISPAAVQMMITQLEGEGIALTTRRGAIDLLRRAFKQAIKWGMVATNPAMVVDRPKISRAAMRVWDADQVARFLQAAQATRPRSYALYQLALATGMRKGELLALQWEDVDLKRGALAIKRILSEVNGQMMISEPKTAAGRRRIELPARVVEALRRHRELMLAEGHPGPWVFPGERLGKPQFKSVVDADFHAITAAAGVPRLRFHDLRHTAATLLLLLGEHPKVVQERLGHSRVSLTLDVYSHVLPSMQRGAADKLDGLLAAIERDRPVGVQR